MFSARSIDVRATLRIAVPLVLGQLAAVGMNVVDSVLAGRHGDLTLAGVAVGSAVWSVALLFAIGVLMAVPPSVSQLLGGGRRQDIAGVFQQACWLALAIGLLLLFGVRGAAGLLPHLGIASEVVPLAAGFMSAIAWGAPALALHFCFRYSSEGLGITRPTLVSGVAGLLALIPLGYALMFGSGPLPELGAAGLGWATALVLWLQAAGFALWLARGAPYRDLQLFAAWQPPQARAIGQLLSLGVPMGISVLMEGGLFVAAGLLIGGMGAVAVAAHQIALNVASVCFMVPLGLAMATTVRVGFAVGAGERAGVRRAAAAGLLLVVLTQLLSAAALALAARPVAGLYSASPAVLQIAVPLLWLAALFQFADGVQAVCAGALRGLKDTRWPMLLTLLAYWGIGMPAGAGLAFAAGYGALGIWVGLALGLLAAAVLLGARLRGLLRG